jgi:hypothetical protein
MAKKGELTARSEAQHEADPATQAQASTEVSADLDKPGGDHRRPGLPGEPPGGSRERGDGARSRGRQVSAKGIVAEGGEPLAHAVATLILGG